MLLGTAQNDQKGIEVAESALEQPSTQSQDVLVTCFTEMAIACNLWCSPGGHYIQAFRNSGIDYPYYCYLLSKVDR